MFDEFAALQRAKCIIKHCEQASFSNMEAGVMKDYLVPF